MKFLILSIMTLTGGISQAIGSERVILHDQKTFTTEVSSSTVRCSALGYGLQELKINLAGLDGWTIFDHTNSQVGEFGEPCMTAGQCKRTPSGPGFSLDDIIKNHPGQESVTVRRQVSEVRIESKDESNNDVCVRSLREDLETEIRGIKFHHLRGGAEQNFGIEYCRK